MENFSEKPKRGRPEAIPPWARDVRCFTAESSYSHRSRVNGYRMFVAVDAIRRACEARGVEFPGPFAWLTNNGRGEEDRTRRTLMYELGKFTNEALLIRAAERLCEERPRTKDALAWLRQVRGASRPKPADADELANRLINLTNEYLRGHPETTWSEVRAALATAEGQIAEAAAEEEEPE